MTRTLPFANLFLLYQLTILPFCAFSSMKYIADLCSCFSSFFNLNLMNCEFLQPKVIAVYRRPSSKKSGNGIAPLISTSRSFGVLLLSAAFTGTVNRLINTMITLNNFIFSIHFVTCYVSLFDYCALQGHHPCEHLTAVCYAHAM